MLTHLGLSGPSGTRSRSVILRGPMLLPSTLVIWIRPASWDLEEPDYLADEGLATAELR